MTDALIPEEIHHDSLLALTPPKISGDALVHRLNVGGSMPAYRIALDVLIQNFAQIQVRPITGKIEQSDPSSFRPQPGSHRRRPMDWMKVN